MIADLMAYPEYRETEQSWLGAVPSHWEVLPNRAIFSEIKERNHSDEQMLSVTINRGVIRQKALLENSSKKDSSNKDKSAYKLVCPGDIAYNKMRAWQCAIGASDLRGIISPAYVVMRLRNDDHNHQYFHHLYRTPQFGKEAERWSYGITSDMWSLRPEHFKIINTPLPPPDEQAAIVRFLNHTNQRIERTIRAKRKVIALLNEQKQVIIHRAVTRGLDSNVRLKPSGIPWLGGVPERWEIRRNSYIFKERNERGQTGLPVLIVSLRTGVTVGSETNEAGRERRLIADHTSYKLACQGDIAYNMMRMWQGAVGVVPALGLVSPAYVVAQPLEGVSSSYYELLFRTDACKGEINRNSRGIVSDRNRLYWDDFKRLFLPVPPLAEQICIVENLSIQFTEADQVISRTEREIDLLREYRTRLIADVVTGKLDVREAAARLPDDTDGTDFVNTDDLDDSCFIEGEDDGVTSTE